MMALMCVVHLSVGLSCCPLMGNLMTAEAVSLSEVPLLCDSLFLCDLSGGSSYISNDNTSAVSCMRRRIWPHEAG